MQHATSCHSGQRVANLDPLKYCFQCRRSMRRATFRTLPGMARTREVCAECYERIMANSKEKKSRTEGWPPRSDCS